MTLRTELPAMLIAIAVGLLFSSFYAISNPEAALVILAAGAVTGFAIYACNHLLESFLTPHLAKTTGATNLVLHGLMYLVGGGIGWVLGMWTSSLLFSTPIIRLGGRGMLFLVVIGFASMLVGFAFLLFNTMSARLREQEWAEKELEIARSIQTRLLPPQHIEGDGFSVAARNLPASFVAGDFYDVVRLDDGSVVIVAADVAGKGVGASLIMASVKAVLPFIARQSVSDAMTTLNAKLVGELDRRQFVALAYARFHPANGALEIANAGFPDPYLIRKDGAHAIEVTGERLPLGVRAGAVYEVARVTLGAGERLLFVSDGMPEARVDEEPLGYERFAALVAANDDALHGEAWLDALLAHVRNETGELLEDDWTAVLVERR